MTEKNVMNQDKPIEEEIVTAILTDLPLSIAQSEEAKGGADGATPTRPPAVTERQGGGFTYSGEAG